MAKINKIVVCNFFFCFLLSISFADTKSGNLNLPITNIFQPQSKYHTHGSNILFLNKSILAVWFHGDGERGGNEVEIIEKGKTISINAGHKFPFKKILVDAGIVSVLVWGVFGFSLYFFHMI